MSTSNEEPPAKRQKRRSLGASDRVVLDVGGTKFISSVSTLTSNSAYFDSLLSDNWAESNDGDDELFIDQDPDPFRVLLAYMREGFIKIGDVNERVLALAEFLGIERLLLAVKIRWYHNIGRGPVHSTDEVIASAFDEKYGGIMKAISAGLFQYFLKQDDINAEKDYAILKTWEPVGERTRRSVKVVEAGKPGSEYPANGIVGALNGLHHKGYNMHEKQLDTDSKSEATYTFSRRRHCALSSIATDIFIQDSSDIDSQRGSGGYIKQFAFFVLNVNSGVRNIFAPAEFHEDESKRSDPFSLALITQCDTWLENNRFTTREKEYEDVFERHFKEVLPECMAIKIFSRGIVHKVRFST